MVKITITDPMFEGWGLSEICECVSKLGYKGLEIAPYRYCDSVEEMSLRKRKEIRNTIESYGLKVVGIHWVFATPNGLHLTHPDKSVRSRTKKYLEKLIVFTADIGGTTIVVGSGKQRSRVGNVPYSQAWKYAKQTFEECVELAENRGVFLCLEPLPRSSTNFINTAGEALRMVKQVNKPNFQLVLDVYAMSDERKPIDEIIHHCKGWIKHFHANDDNKKGPGYGSVDYYTVARSLTVVGYDGYVSVEPFIYTPDPVTIARESLNNMKKFFSETHGRALNADEMDTR